jgi:hypothetical protein
VGFHQEAARGGLFLLHEAGPDPPPSRTDLSQRKAERVMTNSKIGRSPS